MMTILFPQLLAVEPPTLTPFYNSIKWTLIIEILIVVLVGAFGISLHWILTSRKKKLRALRKDLESYLAKMVEQEERFDSVNFPRKFLKVSLLVPVIVEMDAKQESSSWKTLRNSIEEKYLLSKARKLAYSRRWTRQLIAVRCFALSPRIDDEKYLLHLLNNKVPIIKYVAAHATATLGTSSSIDAILTVMNEATRYLRHPFHDALVKGGEKVFHYLEQRLEKETNSYTRVSCIEVLASNMNDHIASLIEKDLTCSHKNLRIAAIRALGHYKGAHTTRLLLPLLNDSEWEIRALAARSLGYLDIKKALKQISELLKDNVWWVRMNAAMALKKMGSEGEAILNSQNPKVDRYAYEIAQYALALQEG
ncbi:MAG: hypothetical protein KR126chlam2_00172 [Chlamydiae bacterium]|nr:hypothetical protein [Chlamydiota bacterium]